MGRVFLSGYLNMYADTETGTPILDWKMLPASELLRKQQTVIHL